jgi:hypothetical protein
MRARVAMWLYLFFGLMGAYCFPQANPLASPYSNSVFKPSIFTSSSQTGTVIQLNALTTPSSTVGSSFASGTITLTGTSLTTVTFALQGSADNGTTYFPLPIFTVGSPSTPPSTPITATANGLYQVSLAGLTHVRFVTSGTFTATSISLTLTASPNALVSRSSSGGGASTPATPLLYKGNGSVNGVVVAAPGTDYVIPSGNTATATALAATPTGCAAGQASNTFDAHGNATGCAPLGSNPAGSDADVQYKFATGFGADSGNLTNNSSTHNFRQKQLNGIPYAGNYSTGANTGINNAFAALGGSGVVVNDSENSSDVTEFGASPNSTVIDLKNGGLGHRLHNCATNPFISPMAFQSGTCESDVIQWDKPYTANGSGGLPFKMTSTFITGPGFNNGNIGDGGLAPSDAGWALDFADFINVDSFRDGISAALILNNNKWSRGDSENIESRLWCSGGNTDISGEACRNMSLQGGQQSFYAHGTITATTGTGDTAPVVAVTVTNVASGSSMIDTTLTGISGTLAGASSSWGESTYLSVLPTSAVLTPSTADCVLLSATHMSSVAGIPQPTVVTCTVGLLGPIVAGKAWAASEATPEEVSVSSVSGGTTPGSTQTFTLTGADAHAIGSNVIQGGTHGCLSFDANLAATGWRSCYYVFGSKDSTHLIYGYLVLGRMVGNTLPMSGNEAETTTAPNNGFHIYPMAIVSYIPAGSFGQAVVLQQNDVAWANGHTVEFVPNPAVNVMSFGIDTQLMSPINGSGSQGIYSVYHGPGITGGFAPLTLKNNNPDSMYQIAGGWATAPTGIDIIGAHQFLLSSVEAPSQAIINIGRDFGVNYTLAQTGGGTITVDPINHQYIFSQNMVVSGSFEADNGAFIQRGITIGGGIINQNLLSDANPPVIIKEQFNNTSCRGVQFGTMDSYPSTTLTPTGRICSGHDFGNNWYTQFHAGWNDQLALTLYLDGSNVEHAAFVGDVSTPALEVGSSFTVNNAGVAVMASGSTIGGRGLPVTASVTTTAATTDVITIAGMTSLGHCDMPGPKNAAAGTMIQNATPVFISGYGTNSVTLNHVATAGATFDLVCTPY